MHCVPAKYNKVWKGLKRPQKAVILIAFVYICRYLQFNLAENHCTKQTNSSSLTFSATLDTQHSLRPRGSIIVKWNKLWSEITVWECSFRIYFNSLCEDNDRHNGTAQKCLVAYAGSYELFSSDLNNQVFFERPLSQ